MSLRPSGRSYFLNYKHTLKLKYFAGDLMAFIREHPA